MASKYQYITGMFNEQIAGLTQNQDTWTSFLKTAANNYKYNFIEQTLIYSQRPDATACAEIETWNEKFNRWVNKGAKGIALFDSSAAYPRLRYVFDVSDTNSFYGNEVELWKAEKRYDEEIKEALSNAFGETAGGSLAAVIDDVAQNMAEDNAVDYLPLIEDLKAGSFLEELDGQMIAPIFKTALANSIGYMMMTRCGISADDFYDKSDFKDVMNFSTHPLVISLGTAVSEVAEMGLREIEGTVRNLQKNERKTNRTFDNSKENVYDERVIKNNTERSNDNGESNLQTSGRLSDSEFGSAAGGKETADEVRSDEESISSGTQESSLGNLDFSGQVVGASLRDSTGSSENGRTAYESDDEISGSDGGTQSQRSDEVGSDDEQYSELGSGNNFARSDLRISGHDFNGRGNGINYFHQDKEKNELIRTYLEACKDEIAEFFEVHSDREERGDFLMTFFTYEPYEMTLSNGVKAGFTAYEDAVYFWRTNKNAPSHECWEKWFQIADSVFGMILIEEWTEPQALLLPSVENQLGFTDSKKKDKYIPLSLPQSAIDYILTRGSGVSEGKMRIYEQFSKSLSRNDNVKFLRNEYGTGGHSDAIPGTGFWENHDGKGILIQDWHSGPKREILLNWSQVEKRISELISVDRYLNPKEKELYPKWLKEQEQRRVEWALEAERRKILQTAPPEQKKYEYQYNIGDTVYIGADEYTITSLTDPVILNDAKFPLFTKEFQKADFEQKVKENTVNNHLRVEVKKQPAEEIADAEVDIIDELFDGDEQSADDSLKAEEATDNPIRDEYRKIKAENPDSIVFYQLGDFFEIMGDDAKTVAQALDILLTSRKLSDTEKIPMCGIPSHRLETYLGMMNDRGFDVTLSTFENGERQNRLIISQNKEDPVNTQPIGIINYLHTDGSVRESIEYTSPYRLKRTFRKKTFTVCRCP